MPRSSQIERILQARAAASATLRPVSALGGALAVLLSFVSIASVRAADPRPMLPIDTGAFLLELARTPGLPTAAVAPSVLESVGLAPNSPSAPLFDRLLAARIVAPHQRILLSTPITRLKAAIYLVRAGAALGIFHRFGTAPPIATFLDETQIPSADRIGFGYLKLLGILRGDAHGRLNPQRFLTEAEAALLIDRLQAVHVPGHAPD